MSKFEDNRREIVNKIIDKIQNENLTFTDVWNRESCRPQNSLSGAKYNGANRIILGYSAVEKGYKDPRWATFIQAKNAGWKMAKGTKSVTCEKWIFPEEKTIEIGGKLVTKEEKPFPKQFYLFNAEQFENVPPFEVPLKLQKEKAYEILQDVINSSEIEIKEIGQDRAYYSPDKDHIVMPPFETFSNDEGLLETVLHEMVHSTGHKSRLNRPHGMKGTNEYAREELIAELGAIFLKQDLGIELKENSLNNSSAYLENYLQVLRDDPNELFRASSEADKASKRIMDNYNEYVNSKEKDQNLENKYFENLEIKYHWSESDFNIKEESNLKGLEAYNFLKELIEKDKKHNEERDKNEDVPYYYKTKMDIVKLGEIENYTDMRVDIGDLEFGGKTKVGEALEHRFNETFNYYLNNLNLTRGELSVEEWKETVLGYKESTKNTFEVFSKEEEEYTYSRGSNCKKIKLTPEQEEKLDKARLNPNYKYVPIEKDNSKGIER